MGHPVDRHTVGALGALGALLIAVWLVGFVVFGAHRGGWHLLLPAGALLALAQVVRRMNGPDDLP